MTPTDEDMKVAREIIQRHTAAHHGWRPDKLDEEIARALASQREECAKIAIRDGCMQMNCGKDIAAAIRAGKKG